MQYTQKSNLRYRKIKGKVWNKELRDKTTQAVNLNLTQGKSHTDQSKINKIIKVLLKIWKSKKSKKLESGERNFKNLSYKTINDNLLIYLCWQI